MEPYLTKLLAINMNHLFIALVPVFTLLVYVYIRDKYEKEPLGLLIRGFIYGAIIVIPIVFVERQLSLTATDLDGLYKAGHTAFVVAALTEELFKFLALYILIWKNKNFNEKFDGIIYAVFVSMGFAAVENIMYVYNDAESAVNVGLLRAVTAVPAHALFGVAMGYYFGIAKFILGKKTMGLIMALFIPILLHGIYDFILMSEISWWLVVFVPFMIYLWRRGLRNMSELSEKSRFNPNNMTNNED
jgi:RsiW-degrading membrane proteinase PrsW (M82 family)